MLQIVQSTQSVLVPPALTSNVTPLKSPVPLKRRVAVGATKFSSSFPNHLHTAITWIEHVRQLCNKIKGTLQLLLAVGTSIVRFTGSHYYKLHGGKNY